jgi:hypothetical protein
MSLLFRIGEELLAETRRHDLLGCGLALLCVSQTAVIGM